MKLLNKCMSKKNKDLARYLEKKFLKRLAIFAEFNKDKKSL